MSAATATVATSFDLPEELEATAPPEARGLTRDGVRLLVAEPEEFRHLRFSGLRDVLRPGDLLVVNTSATLAAAVDAKDEGGRPLTLHFSSPVARDVWVVEPRDGSRPRSGTLAGETFHLSGGGEVELLAGHPGSSSTGRLWIARVDIDRPVEDYLTVHGRPIAYGYVGAPWPLSAYQTIFAHEPGSAEMPSAGRPFTHRLITDLIVRGVTIAPVVLHCGVASLEAGEPPEPERFEVPERTAELVNLTSRARGRIVAVGTTVTRALESAVNDAGDVVPRLGVTDLVLGPDRRARVVTGLLTGWHAPRASHLALLEAVAGPQLVQSAYDEAVGAGYLWHEFGDSCLFLPGQRS